MTAPFLECWTGGKSGDHQTPLLRCRSCTVRLSFARRRIDRAPPHHPSTSRARVDAAASCAPSPLLPRRNTAADPTGDVNANNGAPPVAPAHPPYPAAWGLSGFVLFPPTTKQEDTAS
mmetsp:Transcript_4377/g.10457  ORF Transcript_4377/g.10457 Transcript_4377/m.10457 type:complete len:118 (-) Transcript_4377:228-581(-)